MGRKPSKAKLGEARVRISNEAHECLRRSLSENPKTKGMNMETLASKLITTFSDASLKWHEDKRLFELYNRGLFLDLEAYLKTGWVMPEPFIDALLDIADATTWKKFAEILEKFEKEHEKRG